MNLKYFIDRPVFSVVISVAIVLLGVISLFSLPVEQYPDIAPPTIQVFTSYPGASAETVQKSVVVPLEEAINGVEGMNYITSTAANNGEVFLIVYFKQGTDPDMAAVNVQNRVSTAMGLLPAEVVQIGVTTLKQQNSRLMQIALYSPDDTYNMQFLNNYMKINVEPRVKRVGGVGQVQVMGSNYSMRIWLKPDAMAQYKLVPADISAVLARQNLESATGAFGENEETAFQYTMKYTGRFSTPHEFGNIVVRALPGGEILRLSEVADIELGDEAYNYMTTTDGHPAAIAEFFQTAGSNATAVIDGITEVLDEVEKNLPKGMELVVLMNTNNFLFASIWQVVMSLLVAIVLVILVVYVFLQDVRSTLIPAAAIIVSLVGTFAFMYVAGFSINLLTLFALVLAIGVVVDNAIVVVEAVQSRFDVGYQSAYMAANDAMKGISSAIISSTLIFMAVFIPVAMMGGTSGEFYKQFGLTMAVAVGISAINAFTLSPALCALMLKPYKDESGKMKMNFAGRFRTAFNTAFGAMTQRYMGGVLFFIRKRWLMWTTLVAGIVLLVFLMNATKTSLVPEEDLGNVMISLNTQPGTSLHRTREVMAQFEAELTKIDAINHYASIPGYSFGGAGSSYGMFIIELKHWDERQDEGSSTEEIIARIYEIGTGIPDATIFAMTPPIISGYGSGSGFEIYVQDRNDGDINVFKSVVDKYVEELSKRPEIMMVYSPFETNFPQYTVQIDAAKCEQAGISPQEILETLSGYYGGQYISNFNRFAKLYRVIQQSAPEYRMTAESVNHIYVRVGDEMAPVSQFVTLTRTYGPQTLDRFNLYNAIMINGSPADGYSSGDVINAIRETAETSLPQGYGFEFGGITREESNTSNNTVLIFIICIVLVYLILCSLYESFFIPFAILLAVPVGLMGSFLFATLLGLENNVYMQTGLIMLIGLLAKTAILLTEYATTRRQCGMSLTQAAYAAAKARLRPILMTALTMIFGLLPLMFATGVGANGSRSLATGAVGGMFVGTLVLLFLVPALFIVFQTLQEKFRPLPPFGNPGPDDWAIQAEIEEVSKRKKNKKQ